MMAIHRDAAMRRARRAPRPRYPVETARVHPDAWTLALRLAGGDPHRLRVLSVTEVLVRNQRRSS